MVSSIRIYQLCMDTGYSLEDLTAVIDKDGWWESGNSGLTDWHHEALLFKLYLSVCLSVSLYIYIKIVPYPPYSPDLAPCDFWLFPKLRGCHYETIKEMKEAVMKVIDTRGLPWGLAEVVGMVQQVHCSWRRLLGRGLVFHVCIINKSAHTKKVWKLI